MLPRSPFILHSNLPTPGVLVALHGERYPILRFCLFRLTVDQEEEVNGIDNRKIISRDLLPGTALARGCGCL
ncbi:unnamed protein product [Merluccius merluccius]